ncbi:hypothetical protein JB92DRAFT_1673025 [Gautieria morchelliformis]|nr:hypothetical protein JB92DRAFT_1673025 [Gautieria morchelliformis]
MYTVSRRLHRRCTCRPRRLPHTHRLSPLSLRCTCTVSPLSAYGVHALSAVTPTYPCTVRSRIRIPCTPRPGPLTVPRNCPSPLGLTVHTYVSARIDTQMRCSSHSGARSRQNSLRSSARIHIAKRMCSRSRSHSPRQSAMPRAASSTYRLAPGDERGWYEEILREEIGSVDEGEGAGDDRGGARASGGSWSS